MAEDVEMTPVDATEPPTAATLKLSPVAQRPVVGGAPALKPGLKLPPKPVAASAALKPGLKLPTQTALKPGVKLPPKPVIRRPGATVTAVPLPKPVAPLAAARPAETPAAPAAKPVAVDAQGVGKLPTVAAKAVDRADAAPSAGASPNPMEALKSVTQKLKGITQEIPQQAVLRKTGIIADGAMSEAQKEAAKHKTARISLSDAIGVAPVKNENAPMKTIRIKRPADISGGVKPAVPAASAAPAPAVAELPSAEGGQPETASTVTQRKTLKISRPGGAVRPAGKFGVKRPGSATNAKDSAAEVSAEGESAVAEIADIPEMPVAPVPTVAASSADEGPAWLLTLSTLVQAAACVAIGALAWFLFQNTQVAYF